MVPKAENINDLKKLRVEFKWSQDQLSMLSGLSIRTIQRIENGEQASFESLNSLSAVFKIDFYSNNNPDQPETERTYVEDVRGVYKLLGIAVFSLLLPLYWAIVDPDNWVYFGFAALTWLLILGIYYINTFDVLGEDWKKKLITKKFEKNN